MRPEAKACLVGKFDRCRPRFKEQGGGKVGRSGGKRESDFDGGNCSRLSRDIARAPRRTRRDLGSEASRRGP